MKVVIHAGMHKTGTTSFQKWLAEAEGEAAFVTPSCIDARNPRRFEPARIMRWLDDLRRAGRDRAVVSHEMISLMSSDQLGRLRQALEAGGATRFSYVVTFRHWCGFLPSRWRQNCKRRDAQPFGRFLRDLEEDAARRVDASFDLVLTNAARAGFRDLRVVSYDNASDAGDRGVIAALADACGVPAPPDGPPSGEGLRVNASRDDEEMDLIRLFNGVRSQTEGRALNPLFAEGVPGAPTTDLFYDQRRRVSRVLMRMPELREELRSRLRERRVRHVLAPADFEDWAKRVEAVAGPHLADPGRAGLFDRVRTTTLETSELEATELPEALRRRMLAGLRREEQGEGIPAQLLRRAARRFGLAS